MIAPRYPKSTFHRAEKGRALVMKRALRLVLAVPGGFVLHSTWCSFSYNVIRSRSHAATFADFVRLPFTLGRYIDRLVRL
jgi:hypothetical protein